MKQSADYIRFEKNQFQGKPRSLPDRWGGRVGLRNLSDSELADLGWLPVEYTCRPCNKRVRFRLDVNRRVAIAYAPAIGKSEAMREVMTNLSMRESELFLGNGFPSDALGDEYFYPWTIQSSWVGLAALMLGKPAGLWCWKKDDPVSRPRMHTAEQVRAVFSDAVDFANATYFAEMDEFLEEISQEEDGSAVREIAMQFAPTALRALHFDGARPDEYLR